jgi:hypothetical protein
MVESEDVEGQGLGIIPVEWYRNQETVPVDPLPETK